MSRRVVRIALRTCRPEVFPSTLTRLWSSGRQASRSAMGFYMLARAQGVIGTTERFCPKLLWRAHSGMSFVDRSSSSRKRGTRAPGSSSAPKGRIVSRYILDLSGRFRDKWRRYVLNLLASALRTIRMSGSMFSGDVRRVRTSSHLTTVLVSRHGIPPTRIPHVVLAGYCRRPPQHSNSF